MCHSVFKKNTSFQCPYCLKYVAATKRTEVIWTPSFYIPTTTPEFAHDRMNNESIIAVIFHFCPECHQYSISIDCIGEAVKDSGTGISIRPLSPAKHFPDYVPTAIRQDYEEAYAILHLSPKSSATLSRRCLQGMIRDFWRISEPNLAQSIKKLEGKIPLQQWRVIDGIRRIGNIGAHMEKDINTIVNIDPDEARKLVKLIELLIEQWYIARHEQEELYQDIIEIDTSKQASRKKTE